MIVHLKVHVLIQQLFVEGMVLQRAVAMTNTLSFQHLYSLKQEVGRGSYRL